MSTAACATHTPPLVRHVVRTIRAHRLLDPGMSILVALSGGPDSMALLACLHRLAPRWHLRLAAVHFNYGLRGQESDEDEAFVTTFCRSRNIPLSIERLRLPREAPRGRRSVQEAARELRYQALEELAQRHGCDRIALGHTADDQAETVIMWMLRGAGVTGLSGMRHGRRGSHALFIRPLLDRSREDILGYLSSEGLSFRQDSTNRSRTYRRNRIRHDVMPLLKELNPALLRVLRRQADLMAEDNVVLEQETNLQLSRLVTRREQNQVAIRRVALLALPKGIQRRIIRQVLQEQHAAKKAPSLRQVSAVLNGIAQARTGTSFRVGCCLVTRNSDFVLFESAPLGQNPRSPQAMACPQGSSHGIRLPLAIPSTIAWAPSGQRVTLHVESRQPGHELSVGRDRSLRMIFDTGRFTHTLALRTWRPGDSLFPAGMGGHRKKLQDLFTDMKIPREDRDRVPILVAPEGVLWVVGCRADHRFVPDANTREVLIVEVETAEQAVE